MYTSGYVLYIRVHKLFSTYDTNNKPDEIGISLYVHTYKLTKVTQLEKKKHYPFSHSLNVAISKKGKKGRGGGGAKISTYVCMWCCCLCLYVQLIHVQYITNTPLQPIFSFFFHFFEQAGDASLIFF